jgi:hypothetical protein
LAPDCAVLQGPFAQATQIEDWVSEAILKVGFRAWKYDIVLVAFAVCLDKPNPMVNKKIEDVQQLIPT